MPDKSSDLFFELIQVLSGVKDRLSRSYSDQEWEGALSIAKDQSIAGVFFPAIESLPREQYPSKHPAFHWWNAAEHCEFNTVKIAEAGE